MSYSESIERAIQVAIRAHAGQDRKGQPGVPYVVHPLHVGMMLLRYQFSDEAVIAGILHDVVEDTPYTLEQIRAEFGDPVHALVAEVSEDKSRPWIERKRHTIESIPAMSHGAKAVTVADKLHNLADVARLETERGQSVWNLFSKGRERTLDYYSEVAVQLTVHFPHPLTDQLAALLRRWR